MNDQEAILTAIGSFRMGAPITAVDVRLRAAESGHPLPHMGRKFALYMSARCDSVAHKSGYASWFRRW